MAAGTAAAEARAAADEEEIHILQCDEHPVAFFGGFVAVMGQRLALGVFGPHLCVLPPWPEMGVKFHGNLRMSLLLDRSWMGCCQPPRGVQHALAGSDGRAYLTLLEDLAALADGGQVAGETEDEGRLDWFDRYPQA